MKRILFYFLLFATSITSQAQTNYGGEIVSHQTFGEGLMVTRAKIVPLSGTVSNFFFYNRADEPWNGNVWYEYDWEIRGRFPNAGWSQIRVRSQAGGNLKDAPSNVGTTINQGNELLHYILIRKNDTYVYDIRRDFNVNNYNYNNAGAHGGNSASLLSNGPRVYQTGGSVADIPTSKRLDFSLGITAFDNGWAGSLPNGDYDEDFEVDFTRFYTFSGNNLNTNPQWSDEFNGNSLDFGKWFTANWKFSVTQFRQQNVRVQNGRLYLKINRGNSGGNNNPPTSTPSSGNLALNGSASQSSTAHSGSASRAIDGNTYGGYSGGSVTHTNNQNNAWWQVRLSQTTAINQIVIHNRTDNCCVSRLSNYTVTVLNDNGNTVWSRFYSSAPNSSNTINFNATGRTVRVSLNGTLSLAEVEVYGSGNGGGTSEPVVSNIAPRGSASQSTTAHGGVASRAIDNNTSGVWNNSSVTHTNNQNRPWWQVRLEETSTIEDINIFNRTNCCSNRLSNYTVSILNDGGGTVYSRTFSNSPNPSNSIDVGGVSGRTVRVQLNGTNPLSLAEVQVMGYGNSVLDRSKPLPFAHFTANKDNGQRVALNWMMNQEQKAIQYEVEYKNAEGNFEQIGVVAGIAEDDFRNYQFVHDNPSVGENTYRVKVLFEDYSTTYLEPQSVRFDIENVKVFPNPSNGTLFVNLSEYLDKEVKVILSDLSGKERFKQEFDRNHHSLEELNISQYQNGLYLLFIQAEGKRAISEKISLIRNY